ncbi:MAG: LuxR C-terminal-related transcriptional regulator [Spirochaetia bacterium]|nr:LuxR C-terminal-related transcriptional regulator [Spirochaetia bacterium]
MKFKYLYTVFFKTLTFFLAVVFINCYHDENIEKNYIELRNWEVKLDNKWKKSGIIFWEASEDKGGINAKEYDGFGEYRVYFEVPEHLKNEQLAFFTECFDDADKTYLNNEFIGETGNLPNIKDGIVNMNSFQTGSRKVRLYLLPEKLMNSSSANEIRVRVYDYAGNGGFCYPQKPIIGKYNVLKNKAYFFQKLYDLPRIISLSFILFIIMYCIKNFIKDTKIEIKTIINNFFKRIKIWSFIFSNNEKSNNENYINEAIYFQRFCGLIIFIMFFMGIFVEVDLKYIFISSEIFWFKIQPFASYIIFFILVIILHSDTFGFVLKRKHSNIIYLLVIILSIATHPFFFLFLSLCFIFLPANEVYDFAVKTGLLYVIFCSGILLFLTSVNILRFGIKRKKQKDDNTFIYHGILRLFLFFALTFLFGYFSYKSVLPNFMIFFFIIVFSYWYISLKFLEKYELQLPLPISNQAILFNDLNNNFQLTQKEIEICVQIFKGESREKICEKLKISSTTMKSHLNSIYSKTIDYDNDAPSLKHGKLQRLTVFMHKLTEK